MFWFLSFRCGTFMLFQSKFAMNVVSITAKNHLATTALQFSVIATSAEYVCIMFKFTDKVVFIFRVAIKFAAFG